jgi:hypothetical protein
MSEGDSILRKYLKNASDSDQWIEDPDDLKCSVTKLTGGIACLRMKTEHHAGGGGQGSTE